MSLLLALAVVSHARASGGNMSHQSTCTWNEIGAQYNVPHLILYALSVVESSGRPRAMGPRNRNGTLDVGMMGINSVHWPEIAKFGIQPEHLFDKCVNARVGAWIFARKLAAAKGDLWRAVALYNPGDPNYVSKVYRVLASIGAIDFRPPPSRN